MKQLFILLLSLFIFSACEDIFVKDITDKRIDIVAPANGAIVNKKEITLVWEELNGATDYHVIIVSPSITEVLYYACDSVTKDYKLKVSLPNGVYEWSVQASNSAHISHKSSQTFQIAVP